jgi:hypothetical protein
MLPNVQLRKHTRYHLGVPVIFSWKHAQESRREVVGLTRDISSKGAFILAPECPPLDSSVTLKVFFPPVRGVRQTVQIHGRGEVVRIEPVHQDEVMGGFAVTGKGFVIRRAELRQP